MPTIRELDLAVASISSGSGRLSSEANASGKHLNGQAQRIAYLGNGSQTAMQAARAVDSAGHSMLEASIAMDLLVTACKDYQKVLRQ